MLDVLFVWFFPNCINKFIVWPCQILLDKKLLKILTRNWVKSVFTYLQTFYSVFLINVSTLFYSLSSWEALLQTLYQHVIIFFFFVALINTAWISPYSVWMRENTDQKKLLIWTLFTQCRSDRAFILSQSGHFVISLILNQRLQVERRHFFFDAVLFRNSYCEIISLSK